MKTLKVRLGKNTHPIKIGTGILKKLPQWLGPAKQRSVTLVSDRVLRGPAQTLARDLRRHGFSVHLLFKTSTEALKTWSSVGSIYEELLQFGMDRKSVLIALGGGVIGDVTGFVAGTYLRGISWVNIPTTLLAQVDSAVGGKTGINLKGGKNLVGLFNQPSLVVCDVSLLKSLPAREIQSGLGEVMKYGLLRSRPAPLTRDLEKQVYQCLKTKILIVEKDEREVLGLREVLNLGHTFAHAIESVTKFRRYRHGEAVYLGLHAAIELSVIRGHLARADAEAMRDGISHMRVPSLPRRLSKMKLIAWMKRDKKVSGGRPKFVLLRGRGKPLLDSDVTDQEIKESLYNTGLI
ncbi:MAG: 3-dehydroquinate synthase [Bdellovibrionota bacterium]